MIKNMLLTESSNVTPTYSLDQTSLNFLCTLSLKYRFLRGPKDFLHKQTRKLLPPYSQPINTQKITYDHLSLVPNV